MSCVVARSFVMGHHHLVARNDEPQQYPRSGICGTSSEGRRTRGWGGWAAAAWPAAKAAGLERVTWHQLRHIHASVLHDIGVPAKIAQQQLGHATVETTLNFYTHAIPDTHRRAIERLEQALFPVVPKCSQAGDSGKETKVVIH